MRRVRLGAERAGPVRGASVRGWEEAEEAAGPRLEKLLDLEAAVGAEVEVGGVAAAQQRHRPVEACVAQAHPARDRRRVAQTSLEWEVKSGTDGWTSRRENQR